MLAQRDPINEEDLPSKTRISRRIVSHKDSNKVATKKIGPQKRLLELGSHHNEERGLFQDKKASRLQSRCGSEKKDMKERRVKRGISHAPEPKKRKAEKSEGYNPAQKKSR